MVAYDLFDEGLSLGIFKGFKGRKKDLSRCFACFQCATSIYGIISNCFKDNNFLPFPCSGVGTIIILFSPSLRPSPTRGEGEKTAGITNSGVIARRWSRPS